MTTTAGILITSLLVVCLVAPAFCGALTPGNLLVVRLPDFNSTILQQVYVDEITTGGTVVQTFEPPNCFLHDPILGGISYNQDYTSAAVGCFRSDGNVPVNLDGPKMVVAINPDGTMDITNITTLYGSSITSAFVNGRDVWAASGATPLVYAPRNGQSSNGAVITTPAQGVSFITDMQLLDGVFYIGGLSTYPYLLATVNDGPPRSTEQRSTVTPLISTTTYINPSIDVEGNFARVYVYSPTEIYVTSPVVGLFKIYEDQGWKSYWTDPFVGPALGLVVVNVSTKRMVYVTMENSVVAFEDNGTNFIGQTLVKDYETEFLCDVTYIKAPATCEDGIKNQDETDVDCGGLSCGQCGNAKRCLRDEDCTSNYCNPSGVCFVPSCSDVLLNQNETDVDCGGVCGSTCEGGQACLEDSDCESLICTELLCEIASCSDGVQNQDETDVDCGGDVCSGCAEGKSCVVNGDCESDNCVDNTCEVQITAPFTNGDAPTKPAVSSVDQLSATVTRLLSAVFARILF